MSLNRFTIRGYGQIELNQVAFRRDGRIEAQCAIGKEADGTTDIQYLENGMLLLVNKVNKRIDKTSANAGVIGLNFTTEHMYDERKTSLKNFKLERNTFYPRIGFLATGDRFTTNCLAYDTNDYATETALITALGTLATTPVYGQPCANGAIQLTDTLPTGAVKLQAVEYTTMPDGQPGVKFIVL